MDQRWYHITWLMFHKITVFPINYKKSKYYRKFFLSFIKLIPCYGCMRHYELNILYPNDEMKLNLSNNKLFEWTIDLHNKVNEMNKKNIWSYNKSRKYYQELILTNDDILCFIENYIIKNYLYHKEELKNMIESFFKILPDYYNDNSKEVKKILLNRVKDKNDILSNIAPSTFIHFN